VISVLYCFKSSFNILVLISVNSKLTTDFKYGEESIGLMKLTIHLHRVPELRIDGFTPPSPNTASNMLHLNNKRDSCKFLLCLLTINF